MEARNLLARNRVLAADSSRRRRLAALAGACAVGLVRWSRAPSEKRVLDEEQASLSVQVGCPVRLRRCLQQCSP